MRYAARTALATAALATGLLTLGPAAPAGADDGSCYYVYVYVTNPPSGVTVCEP